MFQRETTFHQDQRLFSETYPCKRSAEGAYRRKRLCDNGRYRFFARLGMNGHYMPTLAGIISPLFDEFKRGSEKWLQQKSRRMKKS